ncbi:archaeal fructose-1,6-bisphosphatase [Corynebacterium kutscheri]|uniref:Inositol-1-monophosphatase n=1 Tax=Corynebacterium kutscheri TaxID=35755 RepID=A0A0F6TDL7_9CORY|nr:inositol monophosphatase family protein [Corynebacterium kutscheri]AKE41371.1 inositol monophosphatase/fructose-1,6-bisphosphatase family protein [Corynebacterium kutscheri]VEH08648.1 archaeal fructose-1,6-bisphosphatase [Corynebacterium kutscheri]VEH09695.1 archaeal fructose-1,6-bisphosphatase [Corynebacterium kutscheri]VEH79777.1 archaeal fructose-1,6-bisphosphatase [Corynebacterium kutscheri]
MVSGYVFPSFVDLNNDDLLPSLASTAVECALQAAVAIKEKRAELGDPGQYARTKSSAVDPVTIVDTMAEEMIVDYLEHNRPGDGIIGEEGSSTVSISGVTWVIDPIDGTVNFIYGIPHYAVSIAAVIDGEVIVGCVVNVATGICYLAARGQGAFACSSDKPRPLTASKSTQLSQALIGTGFSYSEVRRKDQAEVLVEFLPRVRDIRRFGSAALDFCALAEGHLDAYYEHGLQPWDFAAGSLIAAEAGVVVSTPSISAPGAEGHISTGAAPGISAEFSQLISGIPARLDR